MSWTTHFHLNLINYLYHPITLLAFFLYLEASNKSKESNKIFDSVEKKCSKLMLLINSELVHD